MIRALFLFLLLPLVTPLHAEATIQLPKSMGKNDRIQALKIIGFGSSGKLLTDPYPLGGYSGFEAGVAVESFPVEDLGRLGGGLTTPQQDVTTAKLVVGKGLYNDIDVFLHFTPYTKQNELTQFGGLLRWGFYQANHLPLTASVVVHANATNIANQLTSRTTGVDLIGGANVENLAIFAGFGFIETRGVFESGVANLTDTSVRETEFASGFHSVVGADIRIANYFIALQIDRYTLPVFSGKLGVRF